ncbi:hypothetical protein niasHT_001054 [Heterodera trifolii]|uniref:RING-type domain-containing protein n=1 Tax=Heterodera trifolii TaxID=157864 RepID=A0ABD2LMU9_9BILA
MCNNGISNSFHLNLLKSLEDSIDHRIVVEQPLTAAAMFEDQQKQRERERSANNATTNANAKNEEQKAMGMMMNHHHGKGNNNNGGGGGTVPMPLSSTSCSGGFAGSPLLDTGQALSDDPTICPHCNKKFRKPRVLDCLHSMCEDCVIAQLGADIENANKHQLHHPHFGCASTDFEFEQHMNNLRPTPPGVVRCPMCSQTPPICLFVCPSFPSANDDDDVDHRLFPCVSLADSGDLIKANFGPNFKFDPANAEEFSNTKQRNCWDFAVWHNEIAISGPHNLIVHYKGNGNCWRSVFAKYSILHNVATESIGMFYFEVKVKNIGWNNSKPRRHLRIR